MMNCIYSKYSSRMYQHVISIVYKESKISIMYEKNQEHCQIKVDPVSEL